MTPPGPAAAPDGEGPRAAPSTWWQRRWPALSGALWTYLVRGVSRSLGVQGAGLMLSVASSVLLARSLGATAYGYYAFALALLEFLKIPVAYGHPLLIQRELAVRSAEGSWGPARGLLRRTNQAVLAVALTLMVACYAATRWRLLPGHPAGEAITVFQVALLSLPFIGLSAVRGGALNGLHQVALSQVADNIVRPLVTVALVAALLVADRRQLTAPAAMLAQVLAMAAAFAVGGVLLRRTLPRDFASQPPVYLTREWLAAVWPFMLTGGAYALWGTLGIVMLGVFRPAAEVGVYRTAALIAGLALTPVVVFNTTLSPAVARLHAAGDRVRLQSLVSVTTLILSGITAAALAGVIVFGRPVLRLTFGPPFEAAYAPLIALVAGHCCYATISNVLNVLDMTGHQRFSLYALLSSAAINLALAPALIPWLGMSGAAIATGSSWFLGHLWLVPITRRRAGIDATLPFALTHWRAGRRAAAPTDLG